MLRQSPGFEESPVHRCTVPRIRKKKKLVFTSPRFSNRDEDIFVRSKNLFDSSKRWESISEQAGYHQQSGRVLVLHRTISPMALRYGMTRQASLRVRSLSLTLDKREFDLSEWIDIIAETLINLENLSIVDSQFQDLSVTKRMQRVYVLQKMPNLTSIDEIRITDGERSMARSKSSTGSQVVDCDAGDETSSFDSSFRPSLDANTLNDRSIEYSNMREKIDEGKMASSFDHAHYLKGENSECSRSKKLPSSIPSVGPENADKQNDCLDVHTDAPSALESNTGEVEANIYSNGKALIESNRDNVDIDSVTSSHIEWTAACGVLAFRSDNVCAPDIRLPFCGPGARAVCDEENHRLRAEAKKGLQRKNNTLPSVCTPVQRQVPGSKADGSPRMSNGSRCGTKFFPSDDSNIKIKTISALTERNENAPLVKYQMDGTVETISRPLPLVRMHGYNDIQQASTPHAVISSEHDPIHNEECVNETAPALRRKQHVLSSSKENWTNSMFDTIYDEDDDEDEIIMEANNYEIGWSSEANVVE